MSETNIIKLYRVSNNRHPHIKSIESLSNFCCMFFSRDPLSWFPSHLSKEDFTIYEYQIRYNKIKTFDNNTKNFYWASFDLIRECETKQTQDLIKIVKNEDGEYHELTSFGERLFQEGYDLIELKDPKSELGFPELGELLVSKPKNQVLSINVYNH